MFYSSQSTQGFYTPEVNDTMPDDAQELPEGLHEELINGPALGKVIVWGNGLPFLQDPPAPTTVELNALAELRRNAAYTTEADPLFFQFQRGVATRQTWLDKIEEIKLRFPNV